jgi:N utilization substance protein B
MSARSRARRRALDVLYEADIRSVPATEILDRVVRTREDDGQAALNPYVGELVRGVVAHRVEIDERLSTYSVGWSLERMAAVDRSILRIGCFELLWCDDIPDAVAIAEAVELAGELSTEESSSFVNGVLARILEVRPTADAG